MFYTKNRQFTGNWLTRKPRSFVVNPCWTLLISSTAEDHGDFLTQLARDVLNYIQFDKTSSPL